MFKCVQIQSLQQHFIILFCCSVTQLKRNIYIVNGTPKGCTQKVCRRIGSARFLTVTTGSTTSQAWTVRKSRPLTKIVNAKFWNHAARGACSYLTHWLRQECVYINSRHRYNVTTLSSIVMQINTKAEISPESRYLKLFPAIHYGN